MREGSKKLRRLGLAAALLLRSRIRFALDPWHQMSLGQTKSGLRVAAALDDGWTIASPESAGLDGARLCAIAARLKETEADVHAVVIVRHGKLVFEQYFAGYDEPWGLRRRPARHSTPRPNTTCDRPRRAWSRC